MAEHKLGSMDIEVQEKTFDGFMSCTLVPPHRNSAPHTTALRSATAGTSFLDTVYDH